MPKRSAITVLILLVAMAALLGCSAGKNKDLLFKFNESLEAYHHLLNAKDFELAAKYIDPDKNTDFYEAVEEPHKKLKITHYRIRSVTMDDSKTSAEVVIIREFHNLETYEVDENTITQTWKRIDGEWLLSEGDF